MSTGIDIQSVKEYYQHLSDEEIIHIATKDAHGLTPEAREVVKEEIQKRGLNVNIAKGVEAQNKTYTVQELDNYCELIRKLDCPSCGATHAKLNGTMTSEVISFIILTHYSKKLKVACPDCLDKANNDALTKSAIIGWWGFPWGIIRTIQAIANNLKSKKTNRLETPNNYLRSFPLSKIGQLESYKDNKEKLQQIISTS